MALNKSHTSVWVKTLIIILILAFVSLFMYQGFAGIFALFQSSGTQASSTTTTTDPVAALSQQYQPQVDSLKATVASNPTSYTAQVDLANLYFDWAQKLSQPAQGQSQITTSAMTAAFTQWSNAKTAYDAASKLSKQLDPAMETDRSYATFYSNDATGAITIVKTVTQKDPTFAQAWVHLAIYYEATNDTKDAIPAYEKYLKLDPKGQNAAYVQNRLKALGASVPSTSSASTSTP